MEFKDRLRELRESRGLTQEELGQKLNLTKANISKYETGKLQPNIETIGFLTNFFDCTADYLLGRSDYNYYSTEQKELTVNAVQPAYNYQEQSNHVPLLGQIRAGIPILAEENWEREIDVPAGVKADFALRVEGDSMVFAGILPGDLVLLRQSSAANHGQIVAAGVEEAMWSANLKFFVQEKDKYYLRSANPLYPDIELTQWHRIIGVLVGLIREEAPSINDYKFLLAESDKLKEDWIEVIEEAQAAGIGVAGVKHFVEMQKEIAKKIFEGK